MPNEGTPITNSGATAPAENRYNICDRSGFRALPDALIREWDGLMVLPQFSEPRPMQDFVKSRPEHQTGALRAEPIGSETFIDPDNPITADDL